MKYLFLALLLLPILGANAQWTKTNGPLGGYSTEIIKVDNYLFLEAPNSGIYRSSNMGESWDIVMVGKYSNLTSYNSKIYVTMSFSDRILFSGDYGKTWEQVGSDYEYQTGWSLYVHDSIIISATNYKGLYISTDFGETWNYKTEGLGEESVKDIAFFNSRIYAVNSNLFVSDDFGITWKTIDVPSALQNYITGIEYSGNYLMISGDNRLCVTANLGETWSTYEIGSSNQISSFKTNNELSYITTYDGKIIYSDDRWKTSLTTNVPSMKALTLSSLIIDSKIFMATKAGVFSSSDMGVNWHQSSENISIAEIKALAVKDTLVFAGTSDIGIYRSNNQGETWNLCSSGLETYGGYLTIYDLVVLKENLIAATGSGIYQSSDNGNNWHQIFNPPNNEGHINKLISKGDTLIAANTYNGIYTSIDFGVNWVLKSTENLNINSQFKTLAAKGDSIILSNWNSEIYFSLDFGHTWEETTTGATNNWLVDQKVFDDTLYAANQKNVFYSTDFGRNWELVSPFSYSFQIQQIHKIGEKLLIGTDNGVYAFYPFEKKWKKVSFGLSNFRNIQSFATDEAFCYIGTSNSSVWKSNLNGLSIQPVITGISSSLSTLEETKIEIELANLNVDDDDNSFPNDFTLQIKSGANYSINQTSITPAKDFNGDLTIPITVNDGILESSIYDLRVSVSPINDVAQISETTIELFETMEDTPIEISKNNFIVRDPDNSYPDDFTLILKEGENYSLNGFNVLPKQDFNGNLSVGVAVNDGIDESPVYFINIKVGAINDQPQIISFVDLEMFEEDSIELLLSQLTILDPDNNFPADFSLTVLEGDNYKTFNDFIYPDTNYYGPLSVSILVSDGIDNSDTYTVKINVVNINDLPQILSSDTIIVDEDHEFEITATSLTINDPDNIFPDDFKIEAFNGENYSVTQGKIYPDSNFYGSLIVPIKVSDGIDSSIIFNFPVSVLSVNDIPEIVSFVDLEMFEEDSIELLLSQLTILDPDNNFPADFSLTVLEGDNYKTFNDFIYPDTNYYGPLSVSILVSYGIDNSDTYTVKINVVNINDFPQILSSDTIIVDEDHEFEITATSLTINDPDNKFPNDFKIEAFNGNNYSIKQGKIYPDPNFYGSLTVPIKVSDGTDSSLIFNFPVTVLSVNDIPEIIGAEDMKMIEDSSLTLLISNLIIVDPDVTTFEKFTLNILAGANYTFTDNTIYPDTNFAGTLTIPITVNDSITDSPVYNVNVTVTNVNDAPTITGASTITILEDHNFRITASQLLITDPDDHTPETFTVTQMEGENYKIVNDSIVPEVNYYGTLIIPVFVSDGREISPTFNLNVTITSVNDIPFILGANKEFATEMATPIKLELTDFEVSDPDNNYPDDFTLFINDGENYSVDGSSVQPRSDFLGDLSVNISVSDNNDESDNYNIAIIVQKGIGVKANSNLNSFNVFPNPATNLITINFKNEINRKSKLKIFNNIGSIISEQEINPTGNLSSRLINIETLDSGIYFIEITENNNVLGKVKFIKQ